MQLFNSGSYCSYLYFKKARAAGLAILFISFWSFTSCSARPSPKNGILEGQWYIDFTHKDIGVSRTLIRFDTKGNSFTAYTRKNADKDILGGWTSFLARTFTRSLKNGSLLRIEDGIFSVAGDTLHLAGILVTPMGNYNLEGHVAADRLSAAIRNKRGQLGTMEGTRSIPGLPLEDYSALFKKSAELTEQKIYDRRVLQTGEWKDFVKDMQEITPRLQDDLEMIFAFFYKAGKLPFSHFALMKFPPQKEEDESRSKPGKNLFLEEKNTETAYLKISSFGGTAKEVDSVFDLINRKNYKNLIVDLRNNPGGSVEAGMAFATSVADTTLYGGVFLTQKWFNKNTQLPTVKDYQQFPHFTEANFDLIIEGIHNTEGLCLKIIPQQTVYKGNLYILTNNGTASTCEPIVYELQKRKRAVIAGEKTAGAMLNGEIFDLDKGFKMIIPTADYYTSDGFRIDRNGVKPDIETGQEDALKTVLDKLGQ